MPLYIGVEDVVRVGLMLHNADVECMEETQVSR